MPITDANTLCCPSCRWQGPAESCDALGAGFDPATHAADVGKVWCPQCHRELDVIADRVRPVELPSVQIRGDEMSVTFRTFGIESYRLFLKVKALPESTCTFCDLDESYTITAPARFAAMLGVSVPERDVTPLPLAAWLFDDQSYIVRTAFQAKRYAVWSDCGLGKGLRPDCPVLTPTGYVPIGHLFVGDHVIGSNGKPTRIVGFFPRGEQPLYRVTFSDGTSVVCDADHLWNVKSYNDVARGKPWRTLSTRDLAGTQLKYGQHGQSRTWQIPMVSPVQHPASGLPVDPYILGVLLGDGTISGTVSWSKPDREIADRIRGLLPIGTTLGDGQDNVWRITGTKHGSNPLLDTLRSIGLGWKRSWEKFVPAEYLTAGIGDRIALLQGLMDTDGYAGETPEFSSTSASLANAVQQLVESLGGTATISPKSEPVYEYDGEQRIGRPAYRVTLSLPAGINPFSLPRKASAFRTPTRGVGRWIDSIEPCGQGDTICIKVDAEDGLFVIDRYIVTHNTIIELEFARQVIHKTGRKALIFTLNEIVPQIIEECQRFYGDDLPIVRLNSREEMKTWAKAPPVPGEPLLAITNYEKMNHKGDADQIVNELRLLAAVILDESSRLKTGGGKQKWALIKSCKGIEYKLSCTATPAPNEIAEFASQASFLEKMRNDSDIIWTYFHRDPKSHRWTVKRHAREAFFRFMSSWSIYVRDPRRYGWRKDHPTIPEPVVFVHQITPTEEQQQELTKLSIDPTGQIRMFDKDTNAIERARMSQVAKGFRYLKGKGKSGETSTGGRRFRRIASEKPAFVADLIRRERLEGLQVLVWTVFDAESDLIAEHLKGTNFRLLTGSNTDDERAEILESFRTGATSVLISRAALLGYGMNFQCCGSMIFSGWTDSYEAYYQAVRRAYRFGQTKALRIHLPVIECLENDMLENIFHKQAQHEGAISEMEENYIGILQREVAV